MDSEKHSVSPAVIKRLPRYFRYLRELIRMGKTRVSSAELSKMMNVTASQIRQDLNCFGGFGQQGYGYNVNYLYTKICEILGVGCGFRAAVIGAGNLGSALVKSPMFEKRGVDVVAMFDVDANLIGKKLGHIKIFNVSDIERIFEEYAIDIAILTMPKEFAQETADRLSGTGIGGIWNFTGKELKLESDIVIENVHIGDSLMTLCYEIARKKDNGENSAK
ncbi:MAG: redox-sensing transcriptional repressor Rex [Clostridia bacterium]|nr:redox-sensing transcriptional repressor Rex [Clostridia bacterium]